MKFVAVICAIFFAQFSLFGAEDPFWLMPQQKFMPDNHMDRLDKVDEVANLSKEDFDAVLDRVEAVYKPLLKRLYGAELKLVRDWANSTVNAYATRAGKVWEVHMFGGLARRPEITPDGFALVACHELGHHLGGFPFVRGWAANEGQSDYYSTLSCARQLWQHEDNALFALEVPSYPKKLCDDAWDQEADRELCYRVVLAGKSLADLLSDSMAKYETPSKRAVSETDDSHPAGQCRLDTYIAGAVCKVKFDKDVIPKDEAASAKASCLQSRSDRGFRPRCWFKPAL